MSPEKTSHTKSVMHLKPVRFCSMMNIFCGLGTARNQQCLVPFIYVQTKIDRLAESERLLGKAHCLHNTGMNFFISRVRVWRVGLENYLFACTFCVCTIYDCKHKQNDFPS